MSAEKTLLPWNCKNLWEGCILVTIAHAISSAHYPEFSYEHSWDGSNYSTQDSAGTRGTITFHKEHCVGAFRDDHSPSLRGKTVDATNYLCGADSKILTLAQDETFQYLLEDVDGKAVPVITAAIWGDADTLYALENEQILFENGLLLLEIQLMASNEAIKALTEHYDMDIHQVELLISLHERFIKNPEQKIKLTLDEINVIGGDKAGINASKEVFSEMGIEWV